MLLFYLTYGSNYKEITDKDTFESYKDEGSLVQYTDRLAV